MDERQRVPVPATQRRFSRRAFVRLPASHTANNPDPDPDQDQAIQENRNNVFSTLASRKRLVAAGGVLALAYLLKEAPRFLDTHTSSAELIPNTLTMESALSMCNEFTNLYDQIPERYRIGITSQEELEDWVREIVPYFAYDGITDPNAKTGQQGGLIYPQSVHFAEFVDPTGIDQNHSLGSTNLIDHSITLNARMINPVSSWFGDPVSVAKLVHELAHAQKIDNANRGKNRLDEEVSAQIVALETMATMVETGAGNGGNKRVVAPLLGELSTMCIDAAQFMAMREGRMEEYTKERNKIFSPLILARLDKSERFWEHGDIQRGNEILEQYYYVPIREVITAFHNGDRIDGIELPINSLADYNNAHQGEVSGGSYSQSVKVDHTPSPTSTPLPTLPLIIDDLHYFYNHASQIVSDLKD